MEYWNSLAESLFNDNLPQFGASRALMVGRGLYDTPRHSLYKPKLTALRVIMVERMAKPEEVLVVEKDGEVIREVIKDTDAMEQYKFMRQTLVYVLDCVMFSCLTRAHKLALVGMCAVTATSVLHCSSHGRFHLAWT
jgi:hypothetical protein